MYKRQQEHVLDLTEQREGHARAMTWRVMTSSAVQYPASDSITRREERSLRELRALIVAMPWIRVRIPRRLGLGAMLVR